MIFAQIFDMIDIGVVILDKDFKIYKWNHGWNYIVELLRGDYRTLYF